MIHVIATVELRPGARDVFMAEFAQLVPAVRSEQGCLYYAGAIDSPSGLAAQPPLRLDTFVVIERWDSLEALRAHSAAPHMIEWRDRMKPHMIRTTVQVLEPAGEPA